MPVPEVFEVLQEAREAPPHKQLDEELWSAWVAKGRQGERRKRAAFVKAAKWVTLASLFAVAARWSSLPPYDVAVRFAVTAGSLILMYNAIAVKRPMIAGMFGLLALAYNPVAPVFSFSGVWPRVFVVASAVPFLASLSARDIRAPRHV